MSEASAINDGYAGPPEKPVFNPNQQKVTKELVIQKTKNVGVKIVYFFGVGMKRNLLVKKPDGQIVVKLPFVLAVLLVLVSQLILLAVAAVLVKFFEWKIELEEPPLPVSSTQLPPSETQQIVKPS